MDSHDLRAGDTIVSADGQHLTVLSVHQRFEESFPVSNLTIDKYHNYTVGPQRVLVHNTSVCDRGVAILKKLFDKGHLDDDTLTQIANNIDNGSDVLNRVRGAKRTVGLFSSLRGKNLSNLTRQEVGDIGEDVARRLLGENGFTDIISVQNRSGNGIDIVAHASDGRLVFFEVKSSRIGQVGNLSTRQQSMTNFIEDVLGQASTGTGRYRHLDAAAQDTARSLLREFRRDPLNVSGNAVGVDLLNEIIHISPWR